MMNRKIVAIALNVVFFQSEAFVVPTTKVKVIGNCPSFNFAEKYKVGTNTNLKEKRIRQLEEKLADENFKASSLSLQRQVEKFLGPLTGFLDNISDGWALSYADLTPYRYVICISRFYHRSSLF